MKIYKNLDEITVYVFFEIIKTNNYSLLIKSKKNRKNLSDKKLIELEEIFKNIIYEYSIKTNNFKVLSNLKKRFLISKMENEYNLLNQILSIFEKYEEIEVLFVLKPLGYDFVKCDSIDKELNKVIKRIKSLRNQINISKIKYEKQNKKTNEDNSDYDLDLMSLNLERNLDLKYKLDIKKTSMKRWINMISLSKKQSIKNG